MARAKKGRFSSDQELPSAEGLFSDAARSLGFAVSEASEGRSASVESSEAELGSTEPTLKGRRAGLRIERKGRAGKTVTVVEGLGLDEKDLAFVARELRRALGCGASVEEGGIVLQGDNRERIASWMEARGVRVNA